MRRYFIFDPYEHHNIVSSFQISKKQRRTEVWRQQITENDVLFLGIQDIWAQLVPQMYPDSVFVRTLAPVRHRSH